MHAHGTQLDRTQPTERAVSRAVTSVEVLGFVSWTGSGLALVLYVLWAYVPAQTLASVGITYYPSTYWATALPLWCCLALVFCCVAYECSNMLMVPPLWSNTNVTDEFAKIPTGMGLDNSVSGNILPLADLPLTEFAVVTGRRERSMSGAAPSAKDANNGGIEPVSQTQVR